MNSSKQTCCNRICSFFFSSGRNATQGRPGSRGNWTQTQRTVDHTVNGTRRRKRSENPEPQEGDSGSNSYTLFDIKDSTVSNVHIENLHIGPKFVTSSTTHTTL